MTEELRLWTIAESGQVEPLVPVQQMPTEVALEDLLVQNPEMLEPGLKLVGRQTPTQTGWLDLLAVDRDGRLVVYELKRGTLAREAVTQVLDYASDLDAMSITALAGHIAERSGNDGIQGIDDFKQWYADNFDGDDLSRLLPPRMVLIGLGVDPVVERMARFISRGSVDVSVVTFHGFLRGGDRLLARQMEVQPGKRQADRRRRSATVAEKRQALKEYLADHGYEDVFNQVRTDLLRSLPEAGVWEEPGKFGVGIDLTEPSDPSKSKRYVGVYAGHDGSGVYSVSILRGAIRWDEEAFKMLRASIDLSKWMYGDGGFYFTFTSKEEWDERQPFVLEFLRNVMEKRLRQRESET